MRFILLPFLLFISVNALAHAQLSGEEIDTVDSVDSPATGIESDILEERGRKGYAPPNLQYPDTW